jgi:hypothetical protein
MNKFLVVTTLVFRRMAVQGSALRVDEALDRPAKQAEASCTGSK